MRVMARDETMEKEVGAGIEKGAYGAFIKSSEVSFVCRRDFRYAVQRGDAKKSGTEARWLRDSTILASAFNCRFY
jgi:hypothetical protein